jgi:hypothetical protein
MEGERERGREIRGERERERARAIEKRGWESARERARARAKEKRGWESVSEEKEGGDICVSTPPLINMFSLCIGKGRRRERERDIVFKKVCDANIA